jgi:hypothetical protein
MRGCTAAVQSNAKLDSVGTRALSRLRGFDCFYRGFEEDQSSRGIAGNPALKTSALRPLDAASRLLWSSVGPFC